MNNYFFHMVDGTIFQVTADSAQDAWNHLRESEFVDDTDKVLNVHKGEIVKKDGYLPELLMLEKVWLKDAIG